LQWYDTGADDEELESDTEDLEPPRKKKKKDMDTTPLIPCTVFSTHESSPPICSAIR